MREQTVKVRDSWLTRSRLPRFPIHGGLLGIWLCWAIADRSTLFAQPPLEKEVYQDFRNGRPLLPSLSLHGPDNERETQAENEGLRITLPAAREKNWAVEVRAGFSLSGDFEITGTYELLSGERPTKGYGLGVHLNIADNDDRKTFAKVGRVIRVQEGSVHFAQSWHKQAKKDKQTRTKATDTKAGQLRLSRVGPDLRFLVSNGPGQDFHELYFQKDFGLEDMHHIRFGVSDSGSPGNAVDARLVDLRIRTGGLNADKALDPAPLPAPEVLPAPAPPAGRGGSATVLFVGLAVILVVGVLTWLLWLFIRKRRLTGGELLRTEVDSEPAWIQCSACGKRLKVKSEMAGKKVKCPQCGEVSLVAGTNAS